MIRLALALSCASLLLSGCLATTVVGGAAKATGAVVKGGVKVGKAIIP